MVESCNSRDLMDEAIILHCKPYRETSLFVDVLTEGHGRLRLLSKGARRGRHPLSQILRPFSRVRLSWAGQGELPVLTVAEPFEPSLCLQGKALLCGFYISELLFKLLAVQDPHAGVFRLCLETLQALERGADLQSTLRGYELALLEEMGYGLRLHADAEGRPINADQIYLYCLEEGAVPVRSGGRDAVRGATLLALEKRQFSDDSQLLEAKRLMRGVLNHHLNGRPLKSRELFKPTRS
jgi:DNA repair protein RecO (recombination protein O)